MKHNAMISAAFGAACMTLVADNAPVNVTAEELRLAPIPSIAKLGTDWVSVGRTETEGWSTELAHLEDGKLVLIDDAGYQFHAVWATNCPVKVTDSWEMHFTYAADTTKESPSHHVPMATDAGGWTFVMQSSGPTKYGCTSNTDDGGENTGAGLLGVPRHSYGILFNRYWKGVRWITDSDSSSDWMYFSDLDIDKNSPIDVSVGCTGCVWTVTFNQAGKASVVRTKDYSALIGTSGDTFYLGFTGASSLWNTPHEPGVYQTISDVSGHVPNFSARGDFVEYALTTNNWAVAGDAAFDEEKGLKINDMFVSRQLKFAATGQTPLYRDEPFELDFDWACEEYTAGAQGLSFSLVPDKTPVPGSSKNNIYDYFYPNMTGSCGFYIRIYSSGDGLGWHVEGNRQTAQEPLSGYGAGKVFNVHVEYDGAGCLSVNVKKGWYDQQFEISTNFYSILPEVFYPAFNGATPGFNETMRVYVRNYALSAPSNGARELGEFSVSGAQAFTLSSRNASPADPAAHAERLVLGEGAAVTVSPESAIRGGSLAADEIVVQSSAAMSSTAPSAIIVGGIKYDAAATLTLSGRVLSMSSTIDVTVARSILRSPSPTVLLNASSAVGLDDVSFRLLDEDGEEVSTDSAQLKWANGVLTVAPRKGMTIIFR